MNFKGVDYYNIDDLFSDEEKMTKNVIREFPEKETKPLIANAFGQEKPLDMQELAPRIGELGITGALCP